MKVLLAAAAIILLGCGGPPAGSDPVPYATPSATPTPGCAPVCRLQLAAVVSEGFAPTLTPTAIPTATPAPQQRPPTAAAAALAEPSGRWAPGNYTGPDEAREIAAAVGWPAAAIDELIEVIYAPGCRESDGWAVQNQQGSDAWGLAQVWSGWFRYAGLDFADWANAYVNLAAALAAYQYSGNSWAQWSCRPG